MRELIGCRRITTGSGTLWVTGWEAEAESNMIIGGTMIVIGTSASMTATRMTKGTDTITDVKTSSSDHSAHTRGELLKK